MAVDTYSELQAALAYWANRDDLINDISTFSPATIDGAIKQAIANATIHIQRDIIARGGHKSMETVNNSLTTTASTETVSMPSDFASHRFLAITTNPYQVLEFKDPTTLFNSSTSTAKPDSFTIIGASTVYLRPIPDNTYNLRLIYYATIPVLSTTQTTNWLLTSHPDIYVGMGMIELSILLENDNRLQFWNGYYDQKLNDLMGDDRNTRWAAVPSSPRLQVQIA